MGQPCKDYDDPNSPDPNPAWGRTYLTPDQQRMQLDMIATGRYRLKAVAGRFGQTENSIYERRRRDPEFDLEFRKAQAEGEIAQTDLLRKGGPEAEAALFALERVHRCLHPLEEARRKAYNAETQAKRAAAGAGDEATKQIVEVVRAIVSRRPAPPPPEEKAGADGAA